MPRGRLQLPVSVTRLLVRLYPLQTLRFAEFLFARARPEQTETTQLFGYTMSIEVARSTAHRLLCLEGERFVPERRLLRQLVKPGQVVFDVGANIGYYMLLFRQRVGPEGAVVCIEPDPANYRQLQDCVRGNDLQNVELIQAAAGAAPGTVQMTPGLNAKVAAGGSATVSQIRLDELIERAPHFIKIDVEGYEGEVLQGMERILQTQRPGLFVEIHPQWLSSDFNPRQIVDTLPPHYQRIEFWEPPRKRSILQKLRSGYLQRGLIDRIGSFSRRQQVRIPQRSEPYWLVCRAGAEDG